MKDSIKKIAHRKAGMSRKCAKCPLNTRTRLCPFVVECRDSFVDGFIKGVKYQKELNK